MADDEWRVEVDLGENDAREAERVVREPAQEEAEREPIGPGLPDPRLVYMEVYKPEFLRDLGL